MTMDASLAIDDFLFTQQSVFTLDYFCKYLKTCGVKISKEQALEFLHTSDMVFPLINEEFITRAGVFIRRWFSFKPSKEEIQKGHILIGHRCIPFVNPDISPDKLNISNEKYIITPEPCVFSMNLAMDTFALFGEGYVLPYIFNDHSNTKYPLSSVQYSMPNEIELTSWPLDKIIGGEKIKYGDRILCRVVNWEENIVELSVLPAEPVTELSVGDIEREEWYINFENGLINSFAKNGPSNSIEQQLALLYLENQEELCIPNCGSAEEFLKHTKKIGFSAYGVESRIWYANKTVPYIGEWNKNYSSQAMFDNMSLVFSPHVLDCYLERFIFDQREKKSKKTIEELFDEIVPSSLKISDAERRLVLLNIEKRRDILDKIYNQFADYKMAPVRHRVLNLFSQVSSLVCAIGCSGLKLEEFPQQELVILIQLFSHIARIVDEMQNEFMKEYFPYEDVSLSLEGMEETYADISGSLKHALEAITYENIRIVE